MGQAVIRAGSDVPGGFTDKADVVVIGSGAGGGVAAALFAEAGRSVLVIEEGQHVPRARMNQREEQMYPLLYRDGANQTTADGAIAVLQGRVLGGSTVVNMADVTPIPGAVIDHWRAAFGADRFGVDAVREAEAACRTVIGANRIGAHNRNNDRLLAGAGQLGLQGGAFEHNRVGCIGSGYCLVGCAYDAKQSVAITWIPRALATGRCTVQTEAKVDRIETRNGRAVAVVGSIVDRATAVALAPFRVEADHVVLAAGAVHSPLVLLASGIGGTQVGLNLSLQPQVPAAALFPHDIVLWRGIPQSAYVDGTETATESDGLGGFRLEGVSGTPGMSAATMGLWGADLHEFMKRYRQTAACLCLVPDRPAGRIRADRQGRPRIDYTLTDTVRKTLVEAARTAARAWLAAGAEAAMLPFPGVGLVRREADLAALDRLDFRPADAPLISAHPQGTCRMGPDPATSVVGTDLRLHDVPNVQVLDASVFPTTSSSHTMLPVQAFAWLGAKAAIG